MKTERVHAFTRLELVVVIATLGLITVFGASLFGNTRDRSQRVVCQNNLRQIGRAFHVWASDHQGRYAIVVDYSEGGLRHATGPLRLEGIGAFPPGFNQFLWIQYLWAYQGMPSPAILVCPSDARRVTALTFSTNPNGGFVNIRYQNNSTSYALGLHAIPQLPSSILAADRDLRFGSQEACSVIDSARRLGPSDTAWANQVHLETGNLLLNDGRVEELSTAEFRAFAPTTMTSDAPDSTFGVLHFLVP